MKIRKLLIKQLVINILLIMFLFTLDYDLDLRTQFAIVSLIQLAVNLWFLKKNDIPLFSLSTIFVISTYIFHFGELLLYFLNAEEYCVWKANEKSYTIQSYNEACMFSIIASCFVVFGILLSYNKFDTSIKENEKVDALSERMKLHNVYLMGLFLFIVSFGPTLIQQINRVLVVLNGGLYTQTRQMDEALGPFLLLTNFFPFSIIMMMIGKKDNKTFATAVYLGAVVFEVLCMISGNRSLQLIAIITFTFVYLKLVNRIDFKKIVITAVLGYISMAFMNVIMRIRNYGLVNYNVIDLIKKTASENPLYAIIGEFGGTLLTVSIAIYNFPSDAPYKYGLTYFISWLSIYPDTGGLLGQIPRQYVYIYDFVGNKYSLGGSFIGELFANFGWLGSILGVFIGLFVGNTCKRIFIYIDERQWLKLIPLFVLFYFDIFWVRNYFYGFIFTFIWLKVYIKLFSNVFMKFCKIQPMHDIVQKR